VIYCGNGTNGIHRINSALAARIINYENSVLKDVTYCNPVDFTDVLEDLPASLFDIEVVNQTSSKKQALSRARHSILVCNYIPGG
jgi:hypothetical protein